MGRCQDILCPGEHQDDRTGHGKECLVYQAELGSLRVRLQHFFLAAIRGAIGAVVHLFQDFPRSRRQRNRYGGRAKCQREDGAEHEYPKRAAVSITRKAHQGSGNCGFIFVVTVHSVFPPKILFFPYTFTIGVPLGKDKEIFRIFFNFVCRGPYSYNERLKPRCFRAMIRWDFGKKEEVNTLWIWNK